jgi:thiol:disulfide interchange protein
VTGTVREQRGRFGVGLGQALAIWLAVPVLVAFVRHLAVAWSGVVVALVACVLLGQWHQRRARADAAVGAFTGAVLWPVLIGAAIIAIGIMADYRSE